MPEAVIVATARSPIGRANKGSLVDVRPDDLAATIVRRPRSTEVPQLDPSRDRGPHPGLRPAGGRAGLQPRPRRRDPRRAARRPRRHGQPLLLVVAADDPHGRARDQGRRGRRVRRRRRRDREPLRAAASPTACPARTTRRSRRRRGAHQARAEGGQGPWTPLDGPARRLHRDGPDRRERRRVSRGVTREEMDEFAARSQQRAVDALSATASSSARSPRSRTPTARVRRQPGRRHPRRHDRREARRRSSRCSGPTARSPPATPARSTTAPPPWSS